MPQLINSTSASSNPKTCLFIPMSTDAGGLGEYMRCLNIAKALQKKAPDIHIKFIINSNAPYNHQHPFDAAIFKGTTDTKENNKQFRKSRDKSIMDELQKKPGFALFDGCGNGNHFLKCWQKHVPCGYISSRDALKARAFRPRGLLGINYFFTIPPYANGITLTLTEQQLAKVFFKKTITCNTFYNEPNASESIKWLESKGISLKTNLIVLCPGGGMYSPNGKPASYWFYKAALELSKKLNCVCIVVCGGKYLIASEHDSVICEPTLPNPILMGLIKQSRVAIVGGGDMIAQCLSLKTPTVAVPLGPEEQAIRVRKNAAQGYIVESSLDTDNLSKHAESLFIDGTTRSDLIEKLNGANIKNSADTAVSIITSYF